MLLVQAYLRRSEKGNTHHKVMIMISAFATKPTLSGCCKLNFLINDFLMLFLSLDVIFRFLTNTGCDKNAIY